MKLLSDNTDPWNNYAGYTPTYDDEWFEGMGEDDWIYGEGSRFGDDDFGNDPFTNEWAEEGWGMDDDGFGTPTEMKEDEGRGLGDESGGLDVVFIGDSMTEQRQGTAMGKPNERFQGIKEVFDKTFVKDKGGEFDSIAMGISGDTVSVFVSYFCASMLLLMKIIDKIHSCCQPNINQGSKSSVAAVEWRNALRPRSKGMVGPRRN